MAADKGEVKIRRMVDTDLPRVNEIDELLFGEERVPTWPFSFQAYWDVHGPGICFVAELNGEIVGFLAGNILKEARSYSIFSLRHDIGHSDKDRQVGWIDMIGILPEHQGKAVGRKLVEAFQEECKRNNAPMRGIVMDTDEKLNKFLAALDFKKWDMVIYEKD